MPSLFEIFEKECECDIAYVESAIATAKYGMLTDRDTFMEADGSENIFQKLIRKVKEIVEKAISTITEFFSNKKTDSAIKNAEAVAKENPGLMKQKVKVKDYEKLSKINKKAQKELDSCKTPEQVKAVMDKYRKQRNIAIGAGAVAVVSLAACFAVISHKSTTQINNLHAEVKTCTSKLNEAQKELSEEKSSSRAKDAKISSLKNKNDTLHRENKFLNNDLQATKSVLKSTRDQLEKEQNFASDRMKSDIRSTNENTKLIKELEEANARIEILQNEAKDSVNMTRELAYQWMKVGAKAERANQARKEDRAAWNEYKKHFGPDKDENLRNAAGAVSKAADAKAKEAEFKLTNAFETAAVTGDKKYAQLKNRYTALQKILNTGKDSAGNKIDEAEVKKELNSVYLSMEYRAKKLKEKYK